MDDVMIEALADAVVEILKPLVERVEEAEKSLCRLAVLEKRHGIQYRGDWSAQSYSSGDYVRHRGGLWMTSESTNKEPPAGPWDLVGVA